VDDDVHVQPGDLFPRSRGGLVWLSPDDDYDLDLDGGDLRQLRHVCVIFASNDANASGLDSTGDGGNTVNSSCVHNEDTVLASNPTNTQTSSMVSDDPCVSPLFSI